MGNVVVTGRGALTAAGVGVDALLKAVASGVTKLGPALVIAEDGILGVPVGEVGQLDCGSPLLPRIVNMAVEAGRQALDEGGLTNAKVECDLVIGTMSGARSAEDWKLAGREPPSVTVPDGYERFSAVAEMIGQALHLEGRVITVNTACTSGSNAVAHAWELISTKRSKRVLCIGVEELWVGFVLSFKLIGALSSDPCKPYRESVGTTLAEGAGAMLLESEEAAVHRRATSFGSVLGVGQSSDAFHALRPDPSTYGPDLAIDRSLVAAQLNTGDVDLICGHGTGTKANDEVESELYQYKFPGDIPLFATKGIHGHTAGAGGILELIVLLECLRTSYLPACECWHPETPSYSDRRPFDIGVKTGLAIGGLNTSIIVAKPNVDLPREPTMQGVCSAGEATLYSTDWLSPDRQPTEINDTLLSKFQCSLETSATPEFNGGALAQVPRRDWKRLDLLTKMVVSMCGFLLQQVKSIGPDRIGLSYATNLGPMCSWLIASDAMRRGKPLNPRIIPNLSFNSAPSTACATYSLRGPVVSYTSGMQGGMYAFEHAAMVLELGLADAMVVIVADEFTGDHVDDPMFESLSGFDHNLDVLSSVHQGAANPLAIPAVGGILLCRGDLIEGLIDPERIVPIGREVTSGNLAEELGDAKVAPSGTWQSVARFSDLVTTIGVKRTLGSLLESDRKDRIVKSVN